MPQPTQPRESGQQALLTYESGPAAGTLSIPPYFSVRGQVRRLIWPLAVLLTLLSAALQLLAGQTDNLIHDAVFLLLVGLCALLTRWRPVAGSALFFAGLPVILAWLTTSPGIGPTLIADFAGYSAVLVLPSLVAAVTLRRRGLLAFVVHALVVGLFFNLPLPADRVLGVVWHTVLALSVGGVLCGLLRSVEQTMRHLQSSALLDPLTGLSNRRAFDTDLSVAWSGHTNDTALLIIDVDDLKGLNDHYGHAAGDEMLRQFGRFLQAHLLPGTTAYRLGGDEFAVLCRTRCRPRTGPLGGPTGFAPRLPFCSGQCGRGQWGRGSGPDGLDARGR